MEQRQTITEQISGMDIYIQRDFEQILKFSPKKYPEVYKFLEAKWVDVWDEYRTMWDDVKAKIAKEPNKRTRLIKEALSGFGLGNRLPKIELSKSDWSRLSKDIGGRIRKDYKGNWVMADYFQFSVGSSRSTFLIISQIKDTDEAKIN
jgi:hypothetical protein